MDIRGRRLKGAVLSTFRVLGIRPKWAWSGGQNRPKGPKWAVREALSPLLDFQGSKTFIYFKCDGNIADEVERAAKGRYGQLQSTSGENGSLSHCRPPPSMLTFHTIHTIHGAEVPAGKQYPALYLGPSMDLVEQMSDL